MLDGISIVVVASGFTGKFLLREARERLVEREHQLRQAGAISDDEIERNLFLDSLTVGLMEHWRHFHLPLTAVFTALADTIKSNCGSCHNEDKPLDTLHRQISPQCSACHKTQAGAPLPSNASIRIILRGATRATWTRVHTLPIPVTAVMNTLHRTWLPSTLRKASGI